MRRALQVKPGVGPTHCPARSTAAHEAHQVNDRRHLYVDRAQREHDLLINRTNIFLLYNSILIAGFALGSNAPSVVALLPTLGLLTSAIWLYIGERSLMTAGYFWTKVLEVEAQLEPSERVFTDFFAWRERTRLRVVGFSVATYIARVLPLLWVLTWIVVVMIGH